VKNDMPDKNLFMMCKALNTDALSKLPKGYHVRRCKRNELDIWKEMPFDDAKSAEANKGFMTRYFDDVYGNNESLFFQKCLFVSQRNGGAGNWIDVDLRSNRAKSSTRSPESSPNMENNYSW